LNQSEPWASRSVTHADGRRGEPAPDVSGILLRALADVALKHGVSPERLFEGDARRHLEGAPIDVRVPLPQFRALVRRAISLTGEPALGLRCGFSSSESSFDLLSPLLGHVPSLRRAICDASRFSALAFSGAYVHTTESPHEVVLRWEFPRSDATSDRFIAELATAGMLRLLYAFGGSQADVRAAPFEHRRPDHARAYAEMFRGAERFSAPYTGLTLAVRALDRPHLHHNPALQALVHAQAEDRLARLTRPVSLTDRLQGYLRNQPRAHVPDMVEAACDLKLSVRTMRRRLAQEGTSYRALTQRAQCERACELLHDPAQHLKAIAGAVGFADLVAFHRAFKRWTGVTATTYRRASASK
jgi:AraC-like DNA-binding protein